jgi:protein TonB
VTAVSPILPDTTHVKPRKLRRPYRQPVGMPKARDDWRIGSAISVLFHLAVILAIIGPFWAITTLQETEQGAGGAGPVGGGGGGTSGTGRLRSEVLRFVRVEAPPPPPPKPAVTLPPPTPPVIPPVQQPQVAVTPKEPEQIMPVGTGGGTGTDQTAGTGPGSGGGVGTGIGTGRGSGVGPGTGGGNQENFPPTPTVMFIPPLPVPSSARGMHIIAEFDVDATGRVVHFDFTKTRDGGYNRRLSEVLRGFAFKAGHRPDGTPIRMKVQIGIDLP